MVNRRDKAMWYSPVRASNGIPVCQEILLKFFFSMRLPLSSTITNQELADVFAFVSQIVKMNKESFYAARAYEEAGVVIRQLDYELAQRFTKLKKTEPADYETKFAKELEALPSIGTTIAKKLVELFSTGDIPVFQEDVKAFPAGMYPLVKLSGIGAKKALKLSMHFQLTDSETATAKLLEHAKKGEVQVLDGFGEKSEQDLITILEEKYQKSRIPFDQASAIAQKMTKELSKTDSVSDVITLGSLRRKKHTVGDIDMGAVVHDMPKLKEFIKTIPFVKDVLASGESLIRVIIDDNYQIDLKLSPAKAWGSFLQHFTGSKEHNIRLREFALKKGLSLSEHGIKIKETGEIKTFSNEENFYQFIGFTWIPPQERIGGTEFEKYKL